MENKNKRTVKRLNDIAWSEALYKLRRAEHARLAKGDADFRMQQQLSASHILIIAAQGKGTLVLDTSEHRLTDETAHWCLPEQTFGIRSDDDDGLELYLLHFDMYREVRQEAGTSHYVKQEQGLPAGQSLSVHNASETALGCEAVVRLSGSEDRSERFRGQIAFQELLYELMKQDEVTAEGANAAIDRAREHMDRHYNDSLSIEQLGKIAGVSPKYFVDLFKKTFGISAIDYLTELRMNKAKQYLMQSQAKLRDIAHQVGYQDEFYFSRKFKQQVGVSPSVYIKSRKRKIAAYGMWTTGHLLALNIIPYAAPLHPKWTTYYHGKYRNDIPVHLSAFRVNEHWEANIERLRYAAPDIIVSMDGLRPEEQCRLEQAGTVYYVPQSGLDWREQFKLTAGYVGEAKEAESWLSGFDRRVQTARERLKPHIRNDSFLIISINKQQIHAYCNHGIAAIFYGDLQMKPAYRSETPLYNFEITLDQLRSLNPNRLVLNICQDSETLAAWAQLRDSMEWQELEAVRNQKTYRINSDPWREHSPLAHERMIDDTLRLITGKSP